VGEMKIWLVVEVSMQFTKSKRLGRTRVRRMYTKRAAIKGKKKLGQSLTS